ncbi:hypothetical protein S83_005875 [Arachis hypogaea]|nr:uncharacterized protein DS421_12g384660 [Arachis hypogaea]
MRPSSLKFHRCRLIIKTSKSFHMHRSISQPNLLNRDAQEQQQSDAGMSLHEYFKSPEAIQVFAVDGVLCFRAHVTHYFLLMMLIYKLDLSFLFLPSYSFDLAVFVE